MQQRGLDVPFILVSGTIGEDTAVAAMKAGVHDFLLKDRLGRLGPALARELREATVRAERRKMQEQLLLSDRLAALGMLAAGVAHEINNPLSSLLVQLELALNPPEERQLHPEGAQAMRGAFECACTSVTSSVTSKSSPGPPRSGLAPRICTGCSDSVLRMAWHQLIH